MENNAIVLFGNSLANLSVVCTSLMSGDLCSRGPIGLKCCRGRVDGLYSFSYTDRDLH